MHSNQTFMRDGRWLANNHITMVCIHGREIFCATQKDALILKFLSNYSKCGFEVAGYLHPYRGVRGWGHARLNETRGSEILHMLIKKYLGDKRSNLADFLLRRAENEVAIEIKPLSMFHYDYSNRMNDVKVIADK
ncbi:MAG: hypothetical protein M3270_01135 [Thermoproteota archaeon]|nr:hypothetical protein [Thermoproteota archaeon]